MAIVTYRLPSLLKTTEENDAVILTITWKPGLCEETKLLNQFQFYYVKGNDLLPL